MSVPTTVGTVGPDGAVLLVVPPAVSTLGRLAAPVAVVDDRVKVSVVAEVGM
jgi:hypothetical protein